MSEPLQKDDQTDKIYIEYTGDGTYLKVSNYRSELFAFHQIRKRNVVEAALGNANLLGRNAV